MPTYIEPLGFIFVRVSGAVLMFWFLFRFFYYEKIDKKDLLKLALCGLFGVAINQMLFFKGLNLTTPINAAVIMVTNPILVLLFGFAMLSEKFTLRKLIGITLGAVGAFLLITNGGNISLDPNHYSGNILVLLNASSYAIYLVMVKPLMQKYKPITVVSWVFLFGFIFVVPFGWNEFQAISWTTMPNFVLWEVVFVVVGTTFFAYLFNIYGLQTLNASVVSSYIYLQPVLASLIALWVQSDELSFIKLLSATIIFIGVYLVSKKSTLKNA